MDFKAYVTCDKCGKVEEEKTVFIDYHEEDSQEEDIIKFRCPKCLGVNTSAVEFI